MANDLAFRTTMEFAYGQPRELAPGIVRLVANNPSPFTFKGSNTYLVGGASDLAVIDPGPDDPAHFDAILAAVSPRRRITHLLVTHTHRDHTDGVERLRQATGAKVCGYGRASPGAGRSQTSPSGREFIDRDFRPDIVLRDGDAVSGPDWHVEAIFTPGHAPDHLCFALAHPRVLFTGDHVMAWNTTVIAPPEGNMADYMRSLERLSGRDEELFLPGHGGRIEQPARWVKAYLLHRQWREHAILNAIKSGHATIEQIVSLVYGGIDDRLRDAASLSVLAHVEHLIERGLVRCEGSPTFDRPLSAV
jgi:glyoxylase-like metal-dependent hydrolase (beta-lactamase superfamily II)